MVHRLGGIGALSSHNCKLQPLLRCMLVQDLFTTQFVPNRDATPTSWRRVNDSGRHPIPVGAVVVHRQSGDKLGQLRFRHCGSGGHRIRKRMHGARTVRARCAHGSGNTPPVFESKIAANARVHARTDATPYRIPSICSLRCPSATCVQTSAQCVPYRNHEHHCTPFAARSTSFDR